MDRHVVGIKEEKNPRFRVLRASRVSAAPSRTRRTDKLPQDATRNDDDASRIDVKSGGGRRPAILRIVVNFVDEQQPNRDTSAGERGTRTSRALRGSVASVSSRQSRVSDIDSTSSISDVRRCVEAYARDEKPAESYRANWCSRARARTIAISFRECRRASERTSE